MPRLIGLLDRDTAHPKEVLAQMSQTLLTGVAGVADIIAMDKLESPGPYAFAGLSSCAEGAHSEPASPTILLKFAGNYFNRAELQEKYFSDRPPLSAHELLIAAYQKIGLEIFRQLEGEFSALLYDRQRACLHVVRDRYGTHPLFYFKDASCFVVASEIKAILRHPKTPKRPNLGLLRQFLFESYRYSFGGEESFFDQIMIAPSNAILTIRGNEIQRETLWSFDIKERNNITEEEAIAKFHALLEKSFQRRMDTLEEGPGFLLSGGLDSPTVAALAANRSTSPLHSFSICYGSENTPGAELHYDESLYIKPTVDQYSMHWHPVYPGPDAFEETFARMLLRHDEPISTVTWYAHFLLLEHVRNTGFTTVFGGDGGDHALAGLYNDVPYFFADLEVQGRRQLLEEELRCWKALHDHPVYRKDKDIWEFYRQHCFDWNRPGTITGYAWDEARMRGLKPYRAAMHASFRDQERKLPTFPSVSNRYLISKLWQDLLYTSSPPSTRAEAINFSTFGVNLRSVFLDAAFMEFCWSLPGELMIRNGYMKYLIRAAMVGKLPEPVRMKKEHVGLNAPANLWFRNELKGLIQDAVKSDVWSKLEIFDLPEVQRILCEHDSAAKNHMMFLWCVLSVERWFRRWGF